MINLDTKRALVVFSGGQDSTTCLYWAIERFGLEQVEAVCFDYQQRHSIELESARKIATLATVPLTILPMNTLTVIGQNALTEASLAVSTQKNPDTLLPNTFVPGRNLLFILLAASFAYNRHIQHLVIGISQIDYSNYPDCREAPLDALMLSINLGMEAAFILHTPLLKLTKAETVMLAKTVNALDALTWSHTCYQGVYPPCGNCLACQLRAKGFAEAQIPDPLFSRPMTST